MCRIISLAVSLTFFRYVYDYLIDCLINIFQICGGILRLVSLLEVDDVKVVSQYLEKDGEFLATCLEKYYTARQQESQIGKLLFYTNVFGST